MKMKFIDWLPRNFDNKIINTTNERNQFGFNWNLDYWEKFHSLIHSFRYSFIFIIIQINTIKQSLKSY